MKTEFIFVRHGYSMANHEGIFAGNTDVSLTERGTKQAELTAAYLKNEKIDAVYSSDLMRAYDTALPIARSHSLSVIKNKGLREISAGEWEGVPFDQLRERYSDDYSLWLCDIGRARCTGGESTKEMLQRVFETVKKIASQNGGRTVCIATHATPIRALCTVAAGLDAEDMQSVPFVKNASVTRLEYENGKLTAISVDETDHLGEYASRPLIC